MRGKWALAFAAFCLAAGAQDKSERALPPVTVSAKANPNLVEKSYRKMVRGMDLFEREHALAPNAELRFKLLLRQRDTDMNSVELDVVGAAVDFQVPVAADQSFCLPRNAAGWGRRLWPRARANPTWAELW